MNYNLIAISFSLLLFQVQLILIPEKRQELLDKLAQKVDFDPIFNGLREDDDNENSFKAMKYNVTEIQALLKKYKLPENFNYFNKTGDKPDVKNQGSCGSCWSFAATSALAYRYFKYGINISLSPQDGLSCYHPDCKFGNYGQDAQLNLVKNGTVTEGCFPYVSGDGKTIPECPNQCADGTEYKRYYSQNAYAVYNDYQENFNDLAILIMDQLVSVGPVSAGINVYTDFDDFGKDPDKCLNDVYTYDGTSSSRGRHAITITGYGLLNNKFYWLVQNSWGGHWCDNGFIKMEIGEIMDFEFSEPYIKPKKVNPVEIEVTFKEKHEDCSINVMGNSLDNWNNSLEITFTNEKASQNIYFQAGKNKILGENEINCYFEIYRVYFYSKKGTFTFKESKSLGDYNTFKLNSFEGKSFEYYGHDFFEPLYKRQYYVSQAGSKIIFSHKFDGNDDSLPPIFLDVNAKYPLKNCDHIRTSTYYGYDLAYCEITQKDLEYIETNSARLYYLFLCGIIQSTDIYLYKLDPKKYPVFEVIKFIKPENTSINNKTDLILVSNSKVNVPINTEIYFNTIFEIENNMKNSTFPSTCTAQINSENTESYITCHINGKGDYQYQNVYLLPYSLMKYNNSTYFEVIIKKSIKAEEEHDQTSDGFSLYLKYSLSLFFYLLILF